MWQLLKAQVNNFIAALLNFFELEAHFKCGIFFRAHYSWELVKKK